MKEIPQHVSESTKRRNPHLYPVGAMAKPIAKPALPKALDGQSEGRKRGQDRVRVRVDLIAFRLRLYDDDNSGFALKPLRDSIARYLGIDDADQRIEWHYSQQQTRGQEGVLIRVEAIVNQ